ncbi:hypothetical protein PM082_009744 [Marasmius tenuissimus]|nr:hypothetical protein PM082_009744 [Marasmius tenuissimus]
MKLLSSSSFLLPLTLGVVLAGQANAICPGFNYGIGNVQSLGNGVNRWTVYDDSCNAVHGLTTNQNPCNEGIFSCSPPPVLFIGYTNTFTKLRYEHDFPQARGIDKRLTLPFSQLDTRAARTQTRVLVVVMLFQFVAAMTETEEPNEFLNGA